MHELSIMTEAVQMAVEAARSAGAHRITGLRLRVGQRSGAVPDAMNFAWDVARRQTMAETAWLEIESVPATCWCPACQREFEAPDLMSECPRCHQPSADVRRGHELEIASVELD